MFAELQRKLVFEHLATYSKQAFECGSLQDLIAPTKAHLRAVAALVLNDFAIEIRPKTPPQELIELEESKDDRPHFDLVEKISAKGQAYIDAKKIVQMSLEEEIETLLAQKKVQEQSLASFGRHKPKFEEMIMEVVHGICEQVKLLKDAVSRNDETSKSIADKITTIFVEAQ